MALMLMAYDNGVIFEHPRLLMAGCSGAHVTPPDPSTLQRIPPYTKLFYLPGCVPVGLDPDTLRPVEVRTFKGRRVWAVAAFLPPGHLRLLLPAALPLRGRPILPLWAYGAVGWAEEGMVAPFVTIEQTPRWDPSNSDDRQVVPGVERLRGLYPRNRLVQHLARCALEYHCFAGKNLFLQRWEAPLPTSRRCNAECLGCLSWQPPDGCTPSHERIRFRPTVEEVSEVAIHHLEQGCDPLVSFGQGCEGEPLTEASLIEASIRRIRKATSRGIINLNTNGFSPALVRRLVRAGLDSVRVSLASARPQVFQAYHRPRGYSLEDVVEAIATAVGEGAFTMVNYLVFPGVSDQPEEIEALLGLAEKTGLSFIHLKNLNIDPWFYLHALGASSWPPGRGMASVVAALRQGAPHVELGYFNRWDLGAPGRTAGEGTGQAGGHQP